MITALSACQGHNVQVSIAPESVSPACRDVVAPAHFILLPHIECFAISGADVSIQECPHPCNQPRGSIPPCPAGAAASRAHHTHPVIFHWHEPGLPLFSHEQGWLVHQDSHIILPLVKKRGQCGPKIFWQQGSKAEQLLGSPSIIILALCSCSSYKQQPVELGFFFLCFFFCCCFSCCVYLFIPSQQMFVYSLETFPGLLA